MKLYWQYFIVGIIICVTYVWLSVRSNSSYTILQTNVEKLHPNMLNEKLPIVVETPIVDTNQLLDSVFKYQYLKRSSLISKTTERGDGKYVVNKFCQYF